MNVISNPRLAALFSKSTFKLPQVATQWRATVRPRKNHRGVDLISDAPPFGRQWYDEPNAIGNAIRYAKHRSRSDDAVIRVYDADRNVIETHEHKGEVIASKTRLDRL